MSFGKEKYKSFCMILITYESKYLSVTTFIIPRQSCKPLFKVEISLTLNNDKNEKNP